MPPVALARPADRRASDQAKLAGLSLHVVSTAGMAMRLGSVRRTVPAELSAPGRELFPGVTERRFRQDPDAIVPLGEAGRHVHGMHPSMGDLVAT